MSKVTQLLLIRHGEVEERYHHVFGGRIDMELSARGHEQARAMAAYLKPRPVDALYASPMKRARATAEPIARALQREPVIAHDLHEVDFGDWTGLHWDEIHPRHGVSAFARVERGLHAILREQQGRSAAIVCHGGVIRMMLALLLRQPLAEMAKVQVEYASLSRLAHHGERTEVQLVNFTPWRDLA
jgi:broad specificity phosphatase PhoE